MNWKPIVATLAMVANLAWAQSLPNPFFAMDTGTRDATHKTPAEQVALIKDLGFAGIGPIYHGVQDLQEWFAALNKARLKMFALYLPLKLDNVEPCIATLKEIVPILKGHDTMLWLYVTDKNHKPSTTDNDDVAVKALREACGIAQEAGLRVAMYPHANIYVQRTEEAVRLCEKAGCKNLGVTFNLCHWLKVDGKDLQATLNAARSHLFCVTVNGADAGGPTWKELIQPLDHGTYDVSALLRSLVKLGYNGPIGLQHFGIKGDVSENLKHSMDGWKRISAAAAK